MNHLRDILRFVVAVMVVASATGVSAQVGLSTAPQGIVLNAQVGEGVSITLSSHAVNFNLTAGSAANPGSHIVTATTAWNSKPGRDVRVYAFFTSTAAALTNGTGNIPAGNFEIGVNGGPLRAPNLTVTGSGIGGALELFAHKITGLNKSGTRTDALNFNINLSTLPALPAGTYTGTLFIRAQII